MENKDYTFYISGCSDDGGIYYCGLNKNGEIKVINKIDFEKPMYLIRGEGDVFYCLLRCPFEDNGESGLVKLKKDKDGYLKQLDEIKSTKGEVACHLCVADKNVYAVNYISGSVIKMPNRLDVHTGKGVHPIRQDAAHTHFVGITPDNKYIVCVDLGIDTICFYDFDLNLKYSIKVPDGNGPRHLAFSEDAKYMYCVNELANTVSVFEYAEDKTKLKDEYSTLPEDFDGVNTAAAVRVHNGYLYVSNRGHDSVAVYKTDGDKLMIVGIYKVGGKSPRDINIVGDFLVCANESSDNVTVLKIKQDGALEKTGYAAEIKAPLCVTL